MGKQIFFIGGGKGGVGKSIVSMAVIDYLKQQNEKVFLIESDNSNPDVWKAYGGSVESEVIDLDIAEGWIELMNLSYNNPESVFVINSAARNKDNIEQFGEMLSQTLPDLKRRLITLWVINRQRDSLELLNHFMTHIQNTITHVVRNAHCGNESKFELYNGSNIRKLIESKGGKSVTFPDLADRVSDDIYNKRMSIELAIKELPIGNRAELLRWRMETHKILVEVAND